MQISKRVETNIYILFVLVFCSSMLKILDFRLGFEGVFTLCLDIFSVLIIIKYLISNYKKFIEFTYKCVKKRDKFFISIMIFIIYLLFMEGVSLFRNNSIVDIIYCFKNFILPFILLISLYSTQISISVEKIKKIVDVFSIINIVLVISGLMFGWNIMTKIILGESLYAFPLYLFGHSGSMLRVPGIFSDALAQGSFSFLVFIINLLFIVKNKFKEKSITSLYCIIGLIGMILSTNRQVIFAAFFVVLFLIFIEFKKIRKVIISLAGIVALSTCILFMYSSLDFFSLESLFMRFNIWTEIFKNMSLDTNIFNLFFGIGVNASILGEINHQVTAVDNSYLVILNDFGLIGLLLYICLLVNTLVTLFKNYKYSLTSKLAFYYLIYFIIRIFFHSSIINRYDSYIFILIILIGLLPTNMIKRKKLIYINGLYIDKSDSKTEGGMSRDFAFKEWMEKENPQLVNIKLSSYKLYNVLIIYSVLLFSKNATIIMQYPRLGLPVYNKSLLGRVIRSSYLAILKNASKYNEFIIDVSDIKYEQLIDLKMELGVIDVVEKFEEVFFELPVKFIFASKSMRDYACNKYNIKLSQTDIAINGGNKLEKKDTEYLIDNDEGYIRYVYAGTLNRGRQIEEIIDVFLNQEKCKLFLLGANGEWLNEYNLPNHIKYLGAKEEEEAHNFVSMCDVGLIPYDTSKLYYHLAYPTKLSFYITAGIPFLSTEVNEVENIYKEYGIGYMLNITDWKSIVSVLKADDIKNQKKKIEDIKDNFYWKKIFDECLLLKGIKNTE